MPRCWTKLITAAEAATAVKAAGARISRDYAGQELVLVGLLRGGLFVLADLARAIRLPVQVETMLPQSYGAALQSSGRVELLNDIRADLHGRHVLVADDIYDSGRTLQFVREHLAARGARSVEFACLLIKDVAREAPVQVKYGLLQIPNVFVVGCGLDLAGLGRNLRDVWALAPGASEQAALEELRTQLGGGFEAE